MVDAFGAGHEQVERRAGLELPFEDVVEEVEDQARFTRRSDNSDTSPGLR